MQSLDQSNPASKRGSKLMVIGIVVLILVGTAAWNAWDLFGTQGLDPKRVKEMAKAYEKICVEQTKDLKVCKRHIGEHHRQCLTKGISRPADNPKGAPIYDDAAYQACMELARAKR